MQGAQNLMTTVTAPMRSAHRIEAEESRAAMMQYGCAAAGDDELKADQTFDFKLD